MMHKFFTILGAILALTTAACAREADAPDVYEREMYARQDALTAATTGASGRPDAEEATTPAAPRVEPATGRRERALARCEASRPARSAAFKAAVAAYVEDLRHPPVPRAWVAAHCRRVPSALAELNDEFSPVACNAPVPGGKSLADAKAVMDWLDVMQATGGTHGTIEAENVADHACQDADAAAGVMMSVRRDDVEGIKSIIGEP